MVQPLHRTPESSLEGKVPETSEDTRGESSVGALLQQCWNWPGELLLKFVCTVYSEIKWLCKALLEYTLSTGTSLTPPRPFSLLGFSLPHCKEPVQLTGIEQIFPEAQAKDSPHLACRAGLVSSTLLPVWTELRAKPFLVFLPFRTAEPWAEVSAGEKIKHRYPKVPDGNSVTQRSEVAEGREGEEGEENETPLLPATHAWNLTALSASHIPLIPGSLSCFPHSLKTLLPTWILPVWGAVTGVALNMLGSFLTAVLVCDTGDIGSTDV